MKYFMNVYPCRLLITLLLVIVYCNLLSQDKPNYIIQKTISSKSTVRDSPRINGKEVYIVPANSKIKLLDLYENDYWKVEYLDWTGFLNDVFIVKTPELVKYKELCIKHNNFKEAIEAERLEQLKKERELAQLKNQKEEEQKRIQLEIEKKNKIEEDKKLQIENFEKQKKDNGYYKEYPAEDKVMAGIYFGMNKFTAKLKINEFIEATSIPVIINSQTGSRLYEHFIGEYQYSTISDEYLYDFFDELLYFVEFKGIPINWRYYDTEVPSAIKAIETLIVSKYGSPKIVTTLQPRHSLNTGYSYVLRKWIEKYKVIEIRVVAYDTFYTVDLIFKRSDLENKIKSFEEEVKNEKNNKSKKLL